MKNKILITILIFTFLLGACQEMPWKIKEEKEKYEKLQRACILTLLICDHYAGNDITAQAGCASGHFDCY